MENIVRSLTRGENQGVVAALADAFGVQPEQARGTLETVLPEFSRELERLTLSRGGLASLTERMGQTRYEAFLDHPELLTDAAAREDGVAVLDDVFGSKHKSRVVAKRAARQSDLSDETVKAMLPSIAGLFMGKLAEQTRGPIEEVAQRSEAYGAGGFGGDNPFANQQPLPMPGEMRGRDTRSRSRNPYEDFSDILRRKGGRVSNSGSLSNVIRDLFGSALGFQSKGILGWILKAVVARYGWQILQFILRRMMTGR